MLYFRSFRSLKSSNRFPNLRKQSTAVLEGTSSSSHVPSNINTKPVAYWLLGMGGLVAGMVTVGGLTRLTRSGLSMTDWRLQGTLPPMNRAEWEIEFERYKQYPEYKQRQSMSLEEFKFIYWWEYGHRMMGRSLGFFFAGPAVYFYAKGMIPRTLYPRLGLLFSLGGTQGLIGWWMVKSGLELSAEQRKEIRVSPYRLATHLGMAFTTYTLLLWTSFDLLNPDSKARSISSQLSKECIQAAKKHRTLALSSGALIASTVISGAYVAGNDAGRAFNTWPKMGDHWIPEDIFELEPKWRNFVENTALVQFDHRMLAYGSVAAVWANYITALKGPHWNTLPKITRQAFHATAAMSIMQASLGISAILLYVPIEIAAVHQFGSLVLLSSVTALAHSLKFARMLPLVSGTGAGVASAASAAGLVGKAAAKAL